MNTVFSARKTIGFILLHFAVFFCVYFIYCYAFDKPLIPARASVLFWDSNHYRTICDDGYTYSTNQQSNVAFFPAFPYLWRVLHLGVHGIALFNLLLYGVSVFILAKIRNLSKEEILVICGIPSVFFMYLPYSESLFFLVTILIIYGLQKRNIYLSATGFFLASLTRSAGNIFLPALVIMEILSNDTLKNKIKSILINSAANIAGILVTFTFQYLITGEFFGSVQTQIHWGHRFAIPHLPLATFGYYYFLDVAGVYVGVIAGLIVLYAALQKVVARKGIEDKAFLFSAAYLAGITLVIFLFQTGYLSSLNRYVFATAFYAVFCIEVLRWGKPSLKDLGFIVVIFLILLYPFNGYSHIQQVLKSLGIFLFLISPIFVKLFGKETLRIFIYPYYFINVCLQVLLLQKFLDGYWIG
ncbi:MAG: hypothetical protein NTX03_03155 [Bacteroidetes bacterium]|nr:hypothetical protein [Bacteroidota bacterium]